MITQDRVKEVFYYHQGNLYWRVDLGSRAKKNTVAGNKNSGGYFNVQVDKKQYYIHRLIYLYFYGYMPDVIDHKHGLSVGNYLWNLRACSTYQNIANRGLSKNNTSGFKGVILDKKSNKWIARVSFKGKTTQLGLYNEASVAGEVVSAEMKRIHGEFYNEYRLQLNQQREIKWMRQENN